MKQTDQQLTVADACMIELALAYTLGSIFGPKIDVNHAGRIMAKLDAIKRAADRKEEPVS